jgi:calcium/calmodulin-dependent protein kinase I
MCRDLKPENLLYASVEESAPLKLADFGLAQILKPHELMHSACGTPGYVAPEVLRNESTGYGKEVDMWSIGVILYVLLCGFPPFYDEDNSRLFQAIQLGEYEYPSPYWDAVSAEATGLIDKLLVLDPAHRLTAKQALQHPWLTSTSTGSLPHFSKNMRAFNARRRMRGAMRMVQMANALRGFGGIAGVAQAQAQAQAEGASG